MASPFDLCFPGGGIDATQVGALSADAEAAGCAALWSGEVNGVDAVTTLTLAGLATRECGIGTVIPVFTRAPGVLAMTAATMATVFRGRFTLGLGASSPLLVESWNGIPYRRPVDRMRDTVRFVRSALHGERPREPYSTFTAKGFRLPMVPAVPPPVIVAAQGPRMLDVACNDADGVLINWCSPEDLMKLPELANARLRFVFVGVCVAERDEAHRQARLLMADYLSAPAYAEFQRRVGRGPALRAMWDAHAAGDRAEAVRQVPADVIDELIVYGTPAQCRARLAEFAATGARPVVHLLGDAAGFGPNGTALCRDR